MEADGDPIDKIRRSPKYVWFTELALKALIGIVWVLLAFIGNNLAANMADLTTSVQKLQEQYKETTYDIKQLKEGMNLLSMRQDTAVSAAQAAVKQFQILEREVRMFEYYLLELDGKVIKAGLKSNEEAIASKMLKERNKALQEQQRGDNP